MKLLEERIKKDGQVRPGNILKVDGFLPPDRPRAVRPHRRRDLPPV